MTRGTKVEATRKALVTALALLLTVPALAAAQGSHGGAELPAKMFRTGDVCMGCHNGLVTSAGEDVSIGVDWRASMMANSARDPYWQAAVRREVIDHPGASSAIQNECSTCHMPMAAYRAHAGGGQSTVSGHLPIGGKAGAAPPGRADLLAADGVSCAMCHQIGAERLGTEESFVGGFVVDDSTPAGRRTIHGPFPVDAGRSRMMHSATGFLPREGAHLSSSELCATCHTLYTHALDDEGQPAGELPEQVPYLEWKHSAYPDRGTSCQDCHMPVVEDSVPVTGVLGRPRAEVNRHVFRGGNFFMLRMLGRFAGELGVAVPARELDAAARQTVDHLQTRSARLSVGGAAVEGGTLAAEVTVHNLAGHKLPTAYPSRRAWLHVTVTDRNGAVVFESGSFREDGSIVGNDNDDGSTFEPHHRVISSPGQVQVYEAIMEDPDGEVTTGLISAVRYAKDSRLLPGGFDKTAADPDVAVRGGAAGDDDFVAGGDRVRYEVDVSGAEGPFRVRAELWYQPIAHRWARNLEGYDATETDRFGRYYRSMSASSAVELARDAATAR